MANNDDSKPGYVELKPAQVELNKPGESQPEQAAGPSDRFRKHLESRQIKQLAAIGAGIVLVIIIFVVISPDPVSPPDPNSVRASTPAKQPSTALQSGRYEETLAARREIRGRELVQDERIGAVAELQLELEQDNVNLWAEEPFSAAVTLAHAADAHYQRREWQAAAENYQAAEQAFNNIKASWPSVLAEKIQAIVGELEARRLPEAKVQIEALKKIRKTLPVIALLENKLEFYPILFDLLREAEALFNLNQLEEAAIKVAEAAAIESGYPDVLAIAKRVSTAILEREFQKAMAKGLQAIASGRFNDAVGAFSKASELKPKDSAAQEGLADAKARFQLRRLDKLQTNARQAEQDERWQAALQYYTEAQKITSKIKSINQSVEKSQKRLTLDAKLAALITSEEVFNTEERLSYGWDILEIGRKINPKGARLQKQLSQIEHALRQAVKLITLTISSDNKTNIEIYKLGRFGTFKTREFDLKPGKYTIRGTRRGYRDVLHIFKLKTGIVQKSLTVFCQEKI